MSTWISSYGYANLAGRFAEKRSLMGMRKVVNSSVRKALQFGVRHYLKLKGIQKIGSAYEAIKAAIAEHAGADAAKMIVATVAFEVTEIRMQQARIKNLTNLIPS